MTAADTISRIEIMSDEVFSFFAKRFFLFFKKVKKCCIRNNVIEF